MAAARPAEDRAGAELRGHPAGGLWLHPVHRRAVLHRFQDPAVVQLGRLGQLCEALGISELDHRSPESSDLRLALYPDLLGDRAVPRHPDRSEDPDRRTIAADLSLS